MASFQTEMRDGWLVVKCSMNLDAKATNEFLQALNTWVEAKPLGVVIDFSRVFTIEREFFGSSGILVPYAGCS